MQVDTIGTRKYLGNDRTMVPIYRESVLHVGLLQIEAECRRWGKERKSFLQWEDGTTFGREELGTKNLSMWWW